MEQNISSVGDRDSSHGGMCALCNHGGKLLCCDGKGCNRRYHLSCIDPSLDDFPVGVWHCRACVRKKIIVGVHAVSKGIESIWGVREVNALDDIGSRVEKQYFVKYKGLAHVHNRWVAESLILFEREAPVLIAEFHQREKVQGSVWKRDWTIPQCLLRKRPLLSSLPCANNTFIGKHEWLVKWHGLDHEQATWEMETSSFIHSPQGQSLIQDYEICHRLKKGPCFSKSDQGTMSINLPELPGSSSSELDVNLLVVSKLHQYRGKNAIIFDDHARMVKITLFVRSLSSEVFRPFMIITTSITLKSWEEEFLHLAESMNVLVYSGKREVREQIRKLDFYNEKSCRLFEVLITSPDVIYEDLYVLDCIEWEVIVIDECQCSRVSSQFEQIKKLRTDMRLLLARGKLKETIVDYHNVLSLLNSHGSPNYADRSQLDSDEIMGNLKDRLATFIAYERKYFYEFIEYWIPVEISNIQLEQYCATLFSNSLFLCSSSKTENVDALNNLLTAIRKCCEHPYVLDPSLQMLLAKDFKGTKPLDVGIQASGKLQVLDAMLSEMKEQHLKVIILFQFIDSGRDLMGDILDDFLWQRFGPDSYVRIDSAVVRSEKLSALMKFNRERRRFVLLLEKRAASPMIKISSLDAIILFDSDFNLKRDLRTLQKMTLDSQFEHIKLFRLYLSCTIEERVLILATQGKIFEDKIGPSMSRVLLMWGASYLFDNLHNFHENASPTVDASNQSHLKDVLLEFHKILAQNREYNGLVNLSLISQVKPDDKAYCRQTSLSLGKQKIQVTSEESPHTFWAKLFEGKDPKWKYSSVSTPRKRGWVQDSNEQHRDLNSDNSEVVKKQKTVVDENIPENMLKTGSQGGPSLRETGDVDVIGNEGNKMQKCEKALHIRLKPEIAKLSDVLKLPKDVKALVGSFLEYVLHNHNVNRNSFTFTIDNNINGEPEAWLQAFQISLCWTVANLLGHNIQRAKSVALAKEHLNYSCKKEEAEFAYSLLCCLKGVFLHDVKKSMVSGSNLFTDIPRELSNSQKFKLCVENYLGTEEFAVGNSESVSTQEFQMAQRDLWECTKWIRKQCEKQMTKLSQKQKEEKDDFSRKCVKEKELLERKKRIEEAVIRLHRNSLVSDELKKLDNEYEEKFEVLRFQSNKCLKDLESIHMVARNKIRERKACWVEAVNHWAKNELLEPPLKQVHLSGRLSNVEPVCGMVVGDGMYQVASNEVISCNIDDSENTELSSFASGGALVTEGDRQLHSKDPDSAEQIPAEVMSYRGGLHGARAVDVPTHVLPTIYLSEDHICSGVASSTSGGKSAPETISSSDGPENVAVAGSPASGENFPGVPALRKRNDEGIAPLPALEIVYSTAGQESVNCVVPHLSGEKHAGMLNPDVMVSASATVGPKNSLQNVTAVNLPVSEEHVTAVNLPASEGPILDVAMSSVPNGQVSPAGAESLPQVLGSSTFVHLPSSERQNHGVEGTESVTDIFVGDDTRREIILEVNPRSETGGAVDQECQSQECIPQMQNAPPAVEGVSFPSDQVTQVLGPLPSITSDVQARDASDDEGDSAFHDTETSVSHAVIDLTCSSPDLDQPAVELEEQVQQSAAGGSPPSVLSDLPSASENQPSGERQNSNQTSQARGLLAGNAFELANPDVLASLRHTALTSGSSSHYTRRSSDLLSQMPLLQFHDPLEVELERIRKETDQIVKTHEEIKQQLKADCEEEIEKVVSQIRKQYDAKLKEKEADFLLKKEELDSNHDRVLRNKNLAEAFRSKCVGSNEFKVADLHQGESSIIQLLVQLTSQNSTPRPSTFPHMPSAISPAASGDTDAALTARTTDPHSQQTFRRSARLASAATRPVPAPVGNVSLRIQKVHAWSEIRAPSPLLRPSNSSLPFSAGSSLSTSAIPSGASPIPPRTETSMASSMESVEEDRNLRRP